MNPATDTPEIQAYQKLRALGLDEYTAEHAVRNTKHPADFAYISESRTGFAGTFVWSKTPQGQDFWNARYQEYR